MAQFKVGDKVRITPKYESTTIEYLESEFDTIVKIKGNSVLLDYAGGVGQDWWELEELVHYSETPAVAEPAPFTKGWQMAEDGFSQITRPSAPLNLEWEEGHEAIDGTLTDTPAPEIPCALGDKNAEIEALRKELAIAKSKARPTLGNIGMEALIKENRELKAQVEKLKADNAAWETIVMQAAQDFEVLKAENARMKEAIASAYGIVMRNTLSLEHATEDKRGLTALLLPLLQTLPTPQAPKEAVTHVTTTLMVDDVVVHKTDGARMVVSQIMGNRCLVTYRNVSPLKIAEFPIDELMLDYRPSWNRHQAAKESAE